MQIYKITNKLNNKVYIGKDTTNNSNYFGSGKLITYALKKYGVENFDKVILEECDSNQTLCEREKYWINYYNSTDLEIGYNISKGGDGGDTFTNNPDLEKIKKKISDTMKKKKFTETHRQNLTKNHASTKYKKGKTYEEIYGEEMAKNYKEKLRVSRTKYKTEKERLGDDYERVINILRKKISGDKNPMRKHKYIWYHNVESNITTRIIEGGKIPNGFVKGRKPKM